MSQLLANSIVKSLLDAALLEEKCGVYPGDPNGEMFLDVLVLREIAEVIKEYDWDAYREEQKLLLPQVEIAVE